MGSFLSPVVVSFGDEGYFLDRDLAGYRKQPDRVVICVEGSEIKADYELVSILETPTLDQRPRVIVVDNAQKVKPDKAMKAYLEGLTEKSLSVVLAMVVRDARLPIFWTKFGGKVTTHERKKLKTFETNNEVVKWIETELARVGFKADPKMAQIIYMGTGPNLYRVTNEIQKLRLLVPADQSLTVEHLQSILTVGSTVDAWQVVDAASAKDTRKAINLLTSLYKHSTEDPSILLAYSLMKQVERLFVAASMLSKGAGEEDIAVRVGMHPWRCKTFFLPMVRKHSVASLARTMQELCKLDIEVKSTSSSRRTLLELAVLKLAT